MGFGTGRGGRTQARCCLVRAVPRPPGGQHRKLIGPVWTGRGRPPEGHYTKRGAEDWLRDRLLEDAQRAATAPANARTGTTFAEAAEEYLRYAEQDRGCKPSTIRGYRSQLNAHLLPAFGSTSLRCFGGPNCVPTVKLAG